MSRINKEQVKKVAELARIDLTEDQLKHHAFQLEKIIDYINQLDKIDTTDIPCTTRAIEVVNVFREDNHIGSDIKEELLNIAPSRMDDFFKVPKIIKD